MKRILFMVNHRSGSHFVQAMLRCNIKDTFVDVDGGRFDYCPSLPSPVWLSTIPEKQCLFYGVNNPKIEQFSLIQQFRKESVAEAYSIHPPIGNAAQWIANLPPADWTFFFIFRDPRNQIESTCKSANGRPDHWSRERLFPKKIQEAKLQARDIFEMRKDPRFHLINFDKLFDNPQKGLTDMFLKVGLVLNVNTYGPLIKEWNIKHNSSYEDLGAKRRERWLAWTPEERAYFCKHMTKMKGVIK